MFDSQEDNSQDVINRSRGEELRRYYQSSKSKGVDWKVTGRGPGNGDQNAMITEPRISNPFTSQPETGKKTTMFSQENQHSLHGYNTAKQGDQSSDREVSPISGFASIRMNHVNFALEKANGGQSLPSRLKPRHSIGSIGESSSLWVQQTSKSNLNQTESGMGLLTREQGPSNSEEVTGNQTILERIAKLFGDAKSETYSVDTARLNRDNSSSDCRDSQQDINYIQKSGTFPRRFSKTSFSPNLDPSNNKGEKDDQNDSRLSSYLSSNTHLGSDMFSEKNAHSILHDDRQVTNNLSRATETPNYCSYSLERTRNRLSANSRYSVPRYPNSYLESSSTSLNEGNKNVSTVSLPNCGLKEEIEICDFPCRKRLDTMDIRAFSGSKGITQSKHTFSARGAAYHEEIDDVFTCKSDEKRTEGVLEKFRAPSLDSVKNTISMFESLAQQSRGTPPNLQTRRALSVPEHPRSSGLVKMSGSEKNLYFPKFVEGSQFASKDSLREKSEVDLIPSKTTQSNFTVDAKPMLGQCQDRFKSNVEMVNFFKQANKQSTDNVTIEHLNRERVGKKDLDETSSAISTQLGFQNKLGKKSEIQTSKQSNVKQFIMQQTAITSDEDDDSTPTNSPIRAPDTITFETYRTSRSETVNGTQQLPSYPQNSNTLQKIYSSINYSNNNNHETRQKMSPQTTSMGRWSSDEEDYDDDATDSGEDSDSGKSSVTVTSNMSRSDRRSFSLSLMDLCNFGGVDYSFPDDDDEDLPCSRTASISSDISAFSSVTLLSSDELDRLLDDVRGLGDDTLKKYEDVQVVVLHKDVGSGLGFTLAGGVDQNKPITVHKIIPSGVAEQEGSIFEGARVLSINGTPLQDSDHEEALHTLRKARGQAMAVVVLQSGSCRKEATERSGVTGRRIRVTLQKSSSDLGFSLEGGVGSSSGDKPLTVQKIFRGGPERELSPGDVLLEVQGQSLEGMMRLEAWSLIKKLPAGPVEVLIQRPQQQH